MQRDATIDDAPLISRFVSDLATESIGPSLTSEGLAKLLASMDIGSTLGRLEQGWLHILQYAGDDLVGIIAVQPPTHLYHLFVKTDSQRSGIGRALFVAADERTIRDTGLAIETVNSSINAIDIYRRLGFATDGPVVDVDGVRFQPMRRTTEKK